MTWKNESEMDDADALVQRLVRAGRADGPSATDLAAAPAAVATLLAAPAAAALAPATGAAAAHVGKVAASPLLLLKWVGVGALASTSALALVNAGDSGRSGQPPAAVSSVAAPHSVPAAAAPTPQLLPQPVLPAAPPAASVPLVAPSAPRIDVAREVALLDAARQALVEGNAGLALRLLSNLEQLPGRALVPEATVLRVRALLAQGNGAEAKRVAEQYCVVAPSSPQAGVLRALIANTQIQIQGSRL